MFISPMKVATLHTWLALAAIYIPAPKPPTDPRLVMVRSMEIKIYATFEEILTESDRDYLKT